MPLNRMVFILIQLGSVVRVTKTKKKNIRQWQRDLYGVTRKKKKYFQVEELKRRINLLFCIIGKTCSGKTTIAKELERRGYYRYKTYTTRPQREGEPDDAY